MSSSEIGKAFLDLPEKPSNLNADNAAQTALAWIHEIIPYLKNGIYRPEIATKKGGGNCYAQALGCVSLLDAWEIPAGIVLDSGHAHAVMILDDNIRFIDPFSYDPTRKIRDIPKESDMRSGNEDTLQQHYFETLIDGLNLGSFSTYYYQEKVSEDNDWFSFNATTIRGGTSLGDLNNPHIIVDAVQGYQMLCAIGDLARYKLANGHIFPDAREDEYDKVIDLVPDFIDPLGLRLHNEEL